MQGKGTTLSTWAAHASLILMAGQGWAKLGGATQGKARQGECAGIQQVDQPTRYRRGRAGRGADRQGMARQGNGTAPLT
jgi:hypothetical protein